MIKPEDIGKRIRELRKRQGFSLRALAQKSGVAVSFLSKVEAGRGSPTLATLLKLLEALDSSAIEFFAVTVAEVSDVVVQRRANMHEIDDGDKLWRYLFSNHRDIKVVMTYEEYRPGTRNAEQECHPFDICGLVLAGSLTLEAPGRPSMVVKAGDSFFVRAGTLHTATNRGRSLLRLVVAEIPKGKAPQASLR